MLAGDSVGRRASSPTFRRRTLLLNRQRGNVFRPTFHLKWTSRLRHGTHAKGIHDEENKAELPHARRAAGAEEQSARGMAEIRAA
jgi:hypothetical protein